MAAGQRQLSGAASIKNRIGRDVILTYDTRKLCQLILDNEEALKFKTKAQLLYGATKIMRQQSYFLYDDSAKLWSKLKSDMLNPTVSSFIDMDKSIPKSGAITLSDADTLLQFQTSKVAPLFSSLFDFTFNHYLNHHADLHNSSVILRVETSRNTGLESLELLESSAFQHSLGGLFMQQQQQQQEVGQGDMQHQEYVYDNIDIGDMGYDMMDYDLDEQSPQQDISALLSKPLAGQQEAHDDSVFDFPLVAADMQLRHDPQYFSPLNQTSPLIAPTRITATATASYHSLGPIHNASRPPSLVQEEDEGEEEEQDNLSISSISTSHLNTLLPIEAVSEGQAARPRARRMRRMVVENTMLSYAIDYTTDAIVVHRPVEIGVANVRRNKTENQRLTCTRLSLRYPSIVFNATYHKDVLSTEQGVGRQQQQNQGLAFFNRNRLFMEQIEQSRRYDHYRVCNTSGSTLSQFNVPGILRLSHQAASSGGASIRSNSDVHNTPEMHNLELDGDMELERVQEENTSIWQQQHQSQLIYDDTMDYGGDDIDFGTELNVGFSDDLLQQQQQMQQQQQRTQEEEMHEFMEHIKQVPNPFFFHEQFQLARSSSLIVAKSFTNILVDQCPSSRKKP